MADIEQIQKVVPFIPCEMSFSHKVCELIPGINMPNLHLAVGVDSVKQPVKSNSVGPGNMSQRRASAFNDHLDHTFIVLKDV